MRPAQPTSSVFLKLRWRSLAFLLAIACLNPRPEELPSAQNLEDDADDAPTFPALGVEEGTTSAPEGVAPQPGNATGTPPARTSNPSIAEPTEDVDGDAGAPALDAATDAG